MATSNNTIETRVQLKHDTEANWLANPLVPLEGEVIIYSPDNTHLYSRVKIGDGSTSTTDLPFIDSGTIDGKNVEIVKLATRNDFPPIGSEDKLYVDLSTNTIYHCSTSGYSKLSDFNITKTQVSYIQSWYGGMATTASIRDNTLIITNGERALLNYEPITVVSDIRKGELEQ